MTDNATLAQMDRAPGYELGGQEFDSLRSHHAWMYSTAVVHLLHTEQVVSSNLTITTRLKIIDKA